MPSDLRPEMGTFFDRFGVPVTVTRPAPDDTPIETTGIFVEVAEMDVPSGLAFQRKEPQRLLALMRTEVPTVPRGTAVLAPELLGGEVLRWRIDGLERADADHHRVYLIPDPEPES
jgi:hypothetical protein